MKEGDTRKRDGSVGDGKDCLYKSRLRVRLCVILNARIRVYQFKGIRGRRKKQAKHGRSSSIYFSLTNYGPSLSQNLPL
jgi:hypothetical protein